MSSQRNSFQMQNFEKSSTFKSSYENFEKEKPSKNSLVPVTAPAGPGFYTQRHGFSNI